MAMLSLFGVALPVKIDSLVLRSETVGRRSRNAAGWAQLERRREKWILDFELVAKPLDEAMLYRSLILGDGEFWPTLTSAYGSKGLQLGGTGGWTGAGGGNPHNGNGTFRCTSGQTMTVPGTLYNQTQISTASAALFGSTLTGWVLEESSGFYSAFGFSWRTYDTTATVKRQAQGTAGGLGTLGAPGALTIPFTFSVASKNLTVTMPAANFRFSNLQLIPWYLKANEIDMLLVGRNLANYTFPTAPRAYVQTDLLPADNQHVAPWSQGDASMIMLGEIDAMPVQPAFVSGSFQTARLATSGRLIEV